MIDYSLDIRLPGERSDGGVVRRGHGGWSVKITMGGVSVAYLNPITGDGVSCSGYWSPRKVLRGVRWVRQRAAEQRLGRPA